MASLLTGEQMIGCRSRLDRELPTIGFKEFQPSQSKFEQQQIEYALEVRKELLNEERIEKCGNISTAEWKPELMRANVTKKVGKHWEVFGHYKDNCEWLFPEEALFMLETNTLELCYDGVPISVQKGYAILINNSKTDCTLSEYRVYSHLSRQGYRVVRHLPDLTVTHYEKQINLDQYTVDQKRSYDVEKKQTYVSVSERTVSFSDSETKEDFSNMSEDVPGVSRIVQSSFEMLVQENLKTMASNMPSTSGTSTVLHDVVVLDESTVESEVADQPLNRASKLEEYDDELDVIEVPQEPKEIIIETIDSDTTSEESSDNANEDSSSDSESDRDVHWKRTSFQHISTPVEEVNKKYAVRSNYATVQEFLFDRESAAKKNKPVIVIDLVDDGNETVDNELRKFYNEIELIDLASDTENETNCVGEYVKKDRREILDGMPVMNNVNGYVSVTCPDLRLIPDSIRPKNHEYKMLISRVRGDKPRQVTNYRNYRNYNQQRNYHGRGYQHTNSFFNRMRANPWVRQNNQSSMNPLVQQASQIQTLAQGMMQFASTLMNQMCQSQVNTNNNWNMNMTRLTNPTWQGTELFNTNALVQRNFYNERRSNEDTSYSVLPFNQNKSPYQQHQAVAQSSNSFRSQYNLTTVNSYTNSVSNENSPVYHVSANNFSPNVNSYSQNSNSSVDNMFEINKGEYSPVPTKRYNSPNRRYHRRSGGAFQRGGGGRARHSLQSRHPSYQVNNMTVEENRHRDEIPLHSCEDPAYFREDVPLRGDGFIPLSSSSDNHQVPRSNFQNNRRRKRQNLEVVNVEDDDDEVTIISTPRKRLKQENNQKKRKRQGRKRYFTESPERKFRKQQEQNEDEAEIIDIDVTPEELDVKQENGNKRNSVSVDVIPRTANYMADVKPNVLETVNEAAHPVPNIKFESTDVKTEKSADSVKTEKSADSNFLSNISSVPVKSESSREQQQDQKHSASEINRELIRDVKQDLSEQLDTKINLPITQSTVTTKSERLEIKTESDLENRSNSLKIEKDITYNNDNRIENNSINASEIKQETVSDERAKFSEDISQSGCIENSVIVKESSLQENIDVAESCKTVEDSVKPVTSWAEFKSRPISVGTHNYGESQNIEDTVEEDVEDDDVQPLLKPEDCKNIGSVLSTLQIIKRGEAPYYEVCRLKISFDMYLPNSTFKKAQRTLPNYRIVVVESLDPLPSPGEMAELRLRFQDSVQILLAVVMPDTIAFYTFGSVCLPVDDTSYKM